MKTTSLLALAALLAVPALATSPDIELPFNKPLLLAQPDPALAGIGSFLVVFTPDREPNDCGLNWQQLHVNVISRLNEAGLKPLGGIAGNILDVPELRIAVETTEVPDVQKHIVRVQLSFARKVAMPDKDRLYIKADVWKTAPQMQLVSSQDLADTLTSFVLTQVDAFIHAWSVANTPKSLSSAPQSRADASPSAKLKPSVSSAKPDASLTTFVASKNSKVFHKANCSSAQRIAAKNLISYTTRDEAIAAGKRPCERCNP